MAAGLDYAHAQGVLHLDLKPANVLFTAAGRPMLLDFHPGGNHGGPAGGTLPYMAPEQLEVFRGASRIVDARADLYALGVLLYQFFTGRLPFVAGDTSAEGLAIAVAERVKPPDPRETNPAVPPLAAAVVCRLLAPDSRNRFVSSGDLIAELRRLLRDSPLRLPPGPGWLARVFGRLK
jgi:serine/threonine protein kinase